MNQKHLIWENASSLDILGVTPSISKVLLFYDDENAFVSENGTEGYTIEAFCPSATQEMADNILASGSDYAHKGFSASDVQLPPIAEMGDWLSINGEWYRMCERDLEFGPASLSNVSAPAENDVDHEYPYTSSEKREINRKIATTRSQITKTAEEIKLQVEATDGRVSHVEQTVDGITLEVSSATGADGQTYASITLKIGPNSYSGQILLDGNVDVSGQLSADALYSALGDIADLTVDRVSTSRRIVKYLAGDQTDDNFIRIQDQSLEFVAGLYDGGTDQARNPSGLLIYWEDDPVGDGVTLGTDGYPYKDGVRIFTTTAETEWPVTVYTYVEQVKRAITFEQMGEYYVPVDTFGLGDDAGNDKATLSKKQGGLELMYKTNAGTDIGLRLGSDGYADLYGLRKTTKLDFSGWNSGSFTESVDGDITETYEVKFDADGNPVSITDSAGHTTELVF